MRADDLDIQAWPQGRSSALQGLMDDAASGLDAPAAVGPLVMGALSPTQRLARVRAAMRAHPLVLTNANDLWVSTVDSLHRQGLHLALLQDGVAESAYALSRIPAARHTLLVEGGVALILCTSATIADVHLRAREALESPKTSAVLCAGVQRWLWHLNNDAGNKPVRGLRLVHEIEVACAVGSDIEHLGIPTSPA